VSKILYKGREGAGGMRKETAQRVMTARLSSAAASSSALTERCCSTSGQTGDERASVVRARDGASRTHHMPDPDAQWDA
jgi:hypothetical protein